MSLAGAGKPRLPPRFVDGDSDRVREVEAAHAGTHRNAQAHSGREFGEDRRGQPGRLASEDENIVLPINTVEERALSARGECVPAPRASRIECRTAGGPIAVRAPAGVFVVIEPGALELAVVE